MNKAKGYLFVGNNTFVGFVLGEVFAAAGRRVEHIYTPRQLKRCHPEEYFLNAPPSWSKKVSTVDELIENISSFFLKNSSEDWEIVCCGEIESFLLHRLKLTHFWVVDGSDLSENPFKLSEQGMIIRKQLQSSSFLKGIFSSQKDASYACRLLDLAHLLDKTFYFPVRPEVLAAGARKRSLLTSRINNSSISDTQQRRVASFTRRSYSGGQTFSKGTEHIVEALKTLKSTSYSYLLTLSGPDTVRFEREIREIGLQNLTVSDHLKYSSLIDLLSAGEFIILDQFGEGEIGYSGMVRESMVLGHPIISDHSFLHSTPLERPCGLINAYTGKEISDAVLQLQSLSNEQFMKLSLEIIEQAIDLFSVDSWVSKFERKIESLNTRYMTMQVLK
jgi:hypothetical protein